MQLTKQQLSDSDYDTLFTRDPATFIEAIIINLMWAKDSSDQATIIATQKHLFESWLRFYSTNLREHVLVIERAAVASSEAERIAQAEARGELRGRIAALENLPMKKSLLSQYVDLVAVSAMLHELKAQEPIGITQHE